MNISAILSSLDNGVLSEDSAKAIADAFETAVNEKVNDRISLEVEKALNEQDEDHALKLKNLIEAIDKDHTGKLNQVVSAINENHTEKLVKVVNHYRTELNEKAEKFSNKVVQEMSNYLDLYLDKIIPQEQLTEAVANTHAINQLAQVRKIVGFNPAAVNDDIKNVVINSKMAIENLQEQLNRSYRENIELNQSINNIKASLMLEQKTKSMSPTKRSFVTKILSDKTPSYIEENFKYVADMFESDQRSSRNSVIEEATATSVTKGATVPKPAAVQTPNQFLNPVDNYLSALNEIDRRR